MKETEAQETAVETERPSTQGEQQESFQEIKTRPWK